MDELIGAAIDLETTGLTAGKHEIVEMTVLLYKEWEPTKDRFTSQIKPIRPELAEEGVIETWGSNLTLSSLRTAATPGQVRNAFFQWYDDVVGNKILYPLGHNYNGFDKGFLKIFFGDHYDKFFLYKARDSMVSAQFMKDCNKLPSDLSTSLMSMCRFFNITHDAHTSYGDALASLKVYKRLKERNK